MKGLVSAGSQRTADSAAEILSQGGNAVDAAVCAAFTSCLAEIGFVHLGGSGLAQIYEPVSGRSTVYDFFSRTPGLGHLPRPRPLDFYRTAIDYGPTRQEFFLGRASVATPGNLAGLCRMHADLGRLPLREVLDPVIRLADEGVILDDFQAHTCALLKAIYTATVSIREVFMPRGAFVKAGDRVFIPGLSGTLREIRDQGARSLSDGPLGEALVADQRRRGGLVTEVDLKEFAPRRADPIRVPYRNYEVLLPPPCSSGGALTALSLRLLAKLDPSRLQWGGAEHVQLLAEVMAATSRARSHWDELLSRTDSAEAVETFLAPEHLASVWPALEQALEHKTPSTWVAEPTCPASTTHLSVIDGSGMAVSLSHTAGESAGFVVPGTGFIPNNMLGEADLHPGGFHQAAPGEPIVTMMAPAILLREGRVRAVVGSGGSTRIRTALLQLISNLVDFECSLEEAVERPRVHYQDGTLHLEGGHTESVQTKLEEIGYGVRLWNSRSVYFGGAHCVGVSPAGALTGAGDSRRGGATSRA